VGVRSFLEKESPPGDALRAKQLGHATPNAASRYQYQRRDDHSSAPVVSGEAEQRKAMNRFPRGKRANVFDTERFLDVVELLYASTVEDRCLPAAFKSVIDWAGASGVAHLKYDGRTGATLRSETLGLDPGTEDEYVAHYSTVDLRVTPALAMPMGRVYTDHSLVEDGIYRSSEIFDFLVRHHIPHIMAVTVAKDDATFSTFSLQRSLKQGRVLADTQARFLPLLPHLRRALRIREAMQAARASHVALMEVVNRLPFGVIFPDQRCKPITISQLAESLIGRRIGINYVGGKIQAVHPDDDRRLQRAIARAVAPRATNVIPGSTVTVRSPRRTRPIVITIIPVRSADLLGEAVPRCMLVINDPDPSLVPQIDVVMRGLGLSYAEAMLVCLLFSGSSLRDVSEKLNVSINTSKSQLKAIYRKTNCGSHVDLTKALVLAMLSNGPLVGPPADAIAEEK